MQEKAREFSVGPDESGRRLDLFLAEKLALSRSRVRRLLARGAVRLAGGQLGESAKGRTLVTGENMWMGEDRNALMRCQLYRGLDDGTFEDVWESVVPPVYTGAAWNGTFFDMDNDNAVVLLNLR